MWQSQVRELGCQIAVSPYSVLSHLSICEDRKEDIDDVVGECSTIIREGSRTPGIVGEDVREQCLCHPLRFLRRIATRVLQRVREHVNETGIIRRLTGEVGGAVCASKCMSPLNPLAIPYMTGSNTSLTLERR